MSVSENPSKERSPQSAQQQLLITSVFGAVLLLGSLWLVLAGIPYSWDEAWKSIFSETSTLRSNAFLSGALLILVELVVTGVLVYLAYHAVRRQTQPGVRAGIVFYALASILALWIGVLLGGSLEDQFSDNAPLGWGIVGFVFAAIIIGFGFLYLKSPGWQGFLEAVEHQGWFTGLGYKSNQGVRVRRGTIMGIIAITISGVITMAWRKSFGTERADMPNDWEWILPFSEHMMFVPLMYKLQITIPIILSILAIWLAWRIVNIPAFADFLIATEAEMNKVSWTNRRRLFQDTIVVLTTVFLFTGFLFVCDVILIRVLSMPGVRVLLVDPHEEQQKQQQKAEW